MRYFFFAQIKTVIEESLKGICFGLYTQFDLVDYNYGKEKWESEEEEEEEEAKAQKFIDK